MVPVFHVEDISSEFAGRRARVVGDSMVVRSLASTAIPPCFVMESWDFWEMDFPFLIHKRRAHYGTRRHRVQSWGWYTIYDSSRAERGCESRAAL